MLSDKICNIVYSEISGSVSVLCYLIIYFSHFMYQNIYTSAYLHTSELSSQYFSNNQTLKRSGFMPKGP